MKFQTTGKIFVGKCINEFWNWRDIVIEVRVKHIIITVILLQSVIEAISCELNNSEI